MVNLKIFSVAEYVEYLNGVLYERDAVVEGEISEYKINQQKWIFFKVKDEQATLECFSTVFKLRLPLEDGMRVRVYGRPRIYAKTGKFSLSVEWAEPAGEGALKRSFELLKAELEKEGLFAAERKRPLPRFPDKIGLIASRESAAYGDFTKILGQRFGGLEVYLYHVQVQGISAAADIQQAFAYFNAHHKELGISVIALVRGGGSIEDLAAFNSREVAYAVFGSAVPVIAGVGHEQDETIADFVADVRASTPSQAAELLVPHRDDVRRFTEAMAATIQGEMCALAEGALRRAESACDTLYTVLSRKTAAFSAAAGRLALHLKFFGERIIMLTLKIDAQVQIAQRFGEQVAIFHSRTDGFMRLMRSLSPLAVLERGYAIVKRGDALIASVKDVQSKDIISVRLKDGDIGAEVV